MRVTPGREERLINGLLMFLVAVKKKRLLTLDERKYH